MREFIYYSPKKNKIIIIDEYDHALFKDFTVSMCDMYELIYWEYMGELT